MQKIRTGVAASDIVSTVFLILGAVFCGVAAVAALNLDALQAHATGNAAVLPLVFGAIGAPFLAIGILLAVFAVRRRAMMRRVVEEGYFVSAAVANIYPNFNVRVNGQCPYVLECHYQDPSTGALHVFRSRNLFFCPSELENRQVRVYVDRANWKHYYVDVESALPDVELH